MVKRVDSRWWWASLISACVTISALPWALGGVLPVSYWLLLLGAAVATALWAVDALQQGRRIRVHWVLVPVALTAVVSMLQLIPLPEGLLKLVSPRMAELRDFALVPLDLKQARAATHDVPATLLALGRSLGLLLLTWVTLQLGKEKRARRLISISIAVTGVLIALCGLIHQLLGLEALFGLHRFYAPVPLITPFGNTNHLAAFEAFASAVSIALALEAEKREQSIGWGAAAVLCIGIVFLTMSRGGIASAVAVLLMAVAVVALKARARLVWPAVLVLVGLGLGAMFTWDQLRARVDTVSSLEKLQHTKLGTWPMMLTSIRENWPLGLGHGAFELGITRDQTQQLEVTFTHPENLVLQALSDFGLPFGIALMALVLWAFTRVWVQTRDDVVERVLLLAVAGTALHDVFDFALALNALLPATLVLWAAVAGRRTVETETRHRPLLLAGLTLTLVLGATCLTFAHPTVRETERALSEQSTTGTTPEALRSATLAAIDRHPADWALYSLMAEQSAAARKPQDTLAWVNRVIFLRPLDARAHVLAGEALRQLGARTQALIEYKLAFSQGDRSVLRQAMALCGPSNDCERVLVETDGFVRAAWVELGRQQQSEAALTFLKTVIEFGESEAQRREARLTLAQDRLAAAQPEEALAVLDAVADASPEAVRLRAQVLRSLQRFDEALSLLQGLVTASPGDAESVFALADTAAAAGRYGQAREALKRALPLVPTLEARASLFERQAELHELEKHWALAAEAWTTASRLRPLHVDFLYRLASAREREGSARAALEVVKRARGLEAADRHAATDEWIAKLQAQVNGVPLNDISPP